MSLAINTSTIETIQWAYVNTLSNNQKALISNKQFLAGESITNFNAQKIVDTPSYLTVQINDKEHIFLSPNYLQYINHSCNPNCFFDTQNMQLIAITDINIGDELVFFYPSTEWKMQQIFECNCGSANCLGLINGAYSLTHQQQQKYRLSQFILQKLSQ